METQVKVYMALHQAIFLRCGPKSMCNERKLDKWTFSKLETFVCQDNPKNEGKKIFQIMYLIRGFYSEYIKNS